MTIDKIKALSESEFEYIYDIVRRCKKALAQNPDDPNNTMLLTGYSHQFSQRLEEITGDKLTMGETWQVFKSFLEEEKK